MQIFLEKNPKYVKILEKAIKYEEKNDKRKPFLGWNYRDIGAHPVELMKLVRENLVFVNFKNGGVNYYRVVDKKSARNLLKGRIKEKVKKGTFWTNKDNKKGFGIGKGKIDFGERGIYQKNNQLNDLTGREWKFVTRSVIAKQFPPSMQMQLRKQHGGQKPPELCSYLIRIFTKERQIVLDPLMGVGGSLLGASLCNRRAIGFEINKKWVDIYKKVCRIEGLKMQTTRVGDCRKLLRDIRKSSVDFILTDVPYWNMDKLEKTRGNRARRSNLSKFNEKLLQSKEEWLSEMKEIFSECIRVLKSKRYMAIFIGDMYRAGQYHILSADLAYRISQISGFQLKANLIWYDVSKTLHVYGYPFSFVPSMIHQNIIVFKKEE